MPRSDFHGMCIPLGPRSEVMQVAEQQIDRVVARVGEHHTCANPDCRPGWCPDELSSCEGCILSALRLYDLGDIRRFEILDAWASQANSGHRRPGISYYGFKAHINIIANPEAVEQFNSGSDCWCRDLAQDNCHGGCDDCLFCCNYGPARMKVEAFAAVARACGYTITRDGVPDEPPFAIPLFSNNNATPRPPAAEHLGSTQYPVTVPAPTNAPAQLSWDWSVDRFARGFATWCDTQSGIACPPGGCVNCMCSRANPAGADQFIIWLTKNKWVVSIPPEDAKVTPISRPVDYSGTYDQLDDPYKFPSLHVGDLVHVQQTLDVMDPDVTTNWLWIVGRTASGCCAALSMAITGVNEEGVSVVRSPQPFGSLEIGLGGVAQGYMYYLTPANMVNSTDVPGGEGMVLAYSSVNRVVRPRYARGLRHSSWLNGRGMAMVLCDAPRASAFRFCDIWECEN